MPTNLRRLAFAAFALLALAFAWRSLRAAEPLGRDRALLAATAQRSFGGLLGEWRTLSEVVDPERGHPLAPVSVAASLSVFGAGQGGSLAPMRAARFESLAWYLLGCFAFARFLRRFFQPWTGSEQAAAAGWAAALFGALSPLAFPLVATVGARGDVLGLALGTSAAAIFLAGRQDFSVHRQGAALVLALATGLASDLAFFLPPVLSLAEYVSARRQRPRAVRVRTTATTFAVFGAAVAVSLAVRAASGAPAVLPGAWRELGAALVEGRWLALATGTFEKLGLVVLPINAWALGLFGQGVAGVLLLVAIQPGLLAARTAPRLWSFLLGLVAAAFALALFFSPLSGVSSHDVTNSGSLVLPAFVLCAALGAAATALSGGRRWFVPLAFASGSAFLAHYNAVPWVRASHALTWLSSSVSEARAAAGPEARVVVLDPPGATLGVDVVAGALPVLDGGDGSRPVLALERAALPLFASSEALRAAADRGWVFLAPGAPRVDADPTFAAFESRTPYVVRRDASRRAAGASTRWFNDGRSPTLDLDPTDFLALRVRVKPDADTSKPPRLGWRAADDGVREATGVWWRRGGEPTAVFDLANSLDWLASGHVARVWSAEGWAATVEAELSTSLASVAGAFEPRVVGDDWLFTPDEALVAAEDRGRARFTLTLLAADGFASRRASVELGASQELRFTGAEAARRALGTCTWALALELDGCAVARSTGAR